MNSEFYVNCILKIYLQQVKKNVKAITVSPNIMGQEISENQIKTIVATISSLISNRRIEDKTVTLVCYWNSMNVFLIISG
ncbi:hypothetical protein DLD82_05440 [Methanospirillum stamsii]|uniref:Uncharacterized protein n=1 Tax=Methanospirillum stamsii TaxID=1277351 RepID=A0A2V2N570_9EURY|nr:hypothetical protein DLD82_05440 [Methanospirillum stamsii]